MMHKLRLARWWRAPLWAAALLTGAKSFVDNPILGSPRLNRAGLHVKRLKAAHAMARWRRGWLARAAPEEARLQFDRDGYVVIHDFLPAEHFAALRQMVLDHEYETRAHQQGDTITRRIAVGPQLLKGVPSLAALIRSKRWRGILAYVASAKNTPTYYIQTIVGGIGDHLPDPQVDLHSDTFHPSLKAWLFLTDVGEKDRPLTYVAGSHRLSPAREAWEHRKSVTIHETADRLSQRGSFRISPEELPALGLPPPTRFTVPANTLVAIDTCGFHARAHSDRPSVRVEIWAYARRSPYLPWTGLDPLSWGPIAVRRASWLWAIVDRLARRGWMVQHWRPDGVRRPIDR